MSFFKDLKELLFGHIEKKELTFYEKPKRNTAITTSKGADAAHKTTLKKKNYKKTKINDTTVFVDTSVTANTDSEFTKLLEQRVKEAKARENVVVPPVIPNAVAEFKNKEKQKKTKKPKTQVEGNASLVYTKEELKNLNKPKGKK